jgi:hypothetical protein
MYDEQQYLQLTGIREGRSVRRHLPRGLHLVFSDQQHRREDRTVGLWLEHSDEAHAARSYHFADELPPAYAARKQRDYFRSVDANAVRRYVESESMNDVGGFCLTPQKGKNSSLKIPCSLSRATLPAFAELVPASDGASDTMLPRRSRPVQAHASRRASAHRHLRVRS